MKKLIIVLFLSIVGISYSFSQQVHFKTSFVKTDNIAKNGTWEPSNKRMILDLENDTFDIGPGLKYTLVYSHEPYFPPETAIYVAIDKFGEPILLTIQKTSSTDTSFFITVTKSGYTETYMADSIR
jgi:hypothetical protein